MSLLTVSLLISDSCSKSGTWWKKYFKPVGGTQYYMLDVLLIVWIYQIFLGTVSSSRQSSIVIKSIQKLSYISSARILRIQVLQPWQLMCWDGTRGAAPCFGVAIFSRISQAFSGESPSWVLPTVLSLAVISLIAAFCEERGNVALGWNIPSYLPRWKSLGSSGPHRLWNDTEMWEAGRL